MTTNRSISVSLLALVPLALLSCAARPGAKAPISEVSVRDFGARGDGATDDTPAFQRALNAVKGKGGVVHVPVGDYLIRTHLDIPAKVTLEGVWRIPTAWTQHEGSTLLAVEGRGREDGRAFITLNPNSCVKGLTVFYPDQKPEAIQPYPWCIAGAGDNMSIVDCLLVNPYRAVDFGTRPSGRHYIRNLYGQPLRQGIFVDKCFDVGRIENVHFWPFWNWDEKTGIRDWLWKNGEAFTLGRTDWEYVLNTFVFGYRTGYHFVRTKDGPMDGNLSGIGADASRYAVVVDDTQVAGLLITNGQFVSMGGEDPTEVVVAASNTGPVTFSNCGFWGPARQIARIAGKGTVTFNACSFMEWGAGGQDAPAITLAGGSLLVNACTFQQPLPQLECVEAADGAVVMGCRLASPLKVSNPAHADLQTGLNITGKPRPRPAEEPGAIVVDDVSGAERVSFNVPWNSVAAPGNYEGRAHWAPKGTGDRTATFSLPIPKSGRYTLYAWAGPDPNHDHATNAPVTVDAADGAHAVRLDQSRADGQWLKIGAFPLKAGEATLTLSNAADGNVLADAVKAVPAD